MDNGNPLNKMGLGRKLLTLAARHPQLLYDLTDRHRKNVAITFHPDNNRGKLTDAEYADVYGPLEEWQMLSDELKAAALEEFLQPVDVNISAGLRFLQGKEDQETGVEVTKLTSELTAAKRSLQRATQLLQRKEQELNAAKAAMELYNPERNLEVSGLVQLARSFVHGRRESGGNVNRLNGYSLFGGTTVERSQVRVEIKIELPEPPPGILVKVEEKPGESNQDPLLTKLDLTDPGSSKKTQPKSFRNEMRITSVSTTQYFIRSDTAVMSCQITRFPPKGSEWVDEAAAVDSLKSAIMTLHTRASYGNFLPNEQGVNRDTWVYLGHVVGQLDRLIKSPTKVQEKTAAKTTTELRDILECELSRLIWYPRKKGDIPEQMTILTIEPIIQVGKKLDDPDIPIKYVYRRITVQGGVFDPYFLQPLQPVVME